MELPGIREKSPVTTLQVNQLILKENAIVFQNNCLTKNTIQ